MTEPAKSSSMAAGLLTPKGRVGLALAAFQSSPFGFVVLDHERRSVIWNGSAARLLEGIEPGTRCCDLLGCGRAGGPLADGCITELARTRNAQLPEVRVDVATAGGNSAVWVAASPLGFEHEYVLVQLRPGQAGDRRRRTVPHWVGPSRLHVRTLGRTVVESGEGPIGGTWIERRSGQLLKLLIAQRHRVVPTDEIIEALWSGGDVQDTGGVRFLVHTLRQKIEPDRKRGHSSFIIARQGGYTIDTKNVDVDVDVFEQEVHRARAALAREDEEAAEASLRAAIDLYEGDFLADEPYADWALAERDRLRALMTEALGGFGDMRRRAGDHASAGALFARLASMHPFDTEVQRQAIELLLECGRHSDAVRHYEALRQRMLDVFAEEPAFTLADLH